MLVRFLRWVPLEERLTPGEDNEEASLLGYPPIGLWDGRMIEHAEEKIKQPYVPGMFPCTAWTALQGYKKRFAEERNCRPTVSASIGERRRRVPGDYYAAQSVVSGCHVPCW